MKIAHVVSTFYPHQGGMGAVVYDEARALTARGHAVTVFTMRYPGDVEREGRDGFFIERLNPVFRLGDGGMVRWRNTFNGFDVVHLHVPWYGAMSGAIMECNRAKKPFVATVHMTGRPEGLVKKLFKFFDEAKTNRNLFTWAKKIFVVNKKYFENSYKGLSKASELANPIDTALFSPGEPERTIFGELNQPGTKIILFVGNLMPIKRLDVLLRAIAAGQKEWRVAVVGGGYTEAEYKKLAEKLKISNQVRFFGPIERRKLPQFYRGADVVVVPSETESFSLVAVEAAASGTPVIVSNVVGAQERVVEGAVVFNPGDHMDLVKKLEMVFARSSGEKESLKNNNSSIVRKNFSLDKHVEMLESVYNSIT